MRRVDYISYDDEGEEQLECGVGIFNGSLQGVENPDHPMVEAMISDQFLVDLGPEMHLSELCKKYNSQVGFCTEPYDDDDSSYDGNGVFLDLGLELAFCPTGPGGGQNNSCPPGGGGSGAALLGSLKSQEKDLLQKSKDIAKKIKKKKQSGDTAGLAKMKKERAAINKQLVDVQKKISDVHKGVLQANPKPAVEYKQGPKGIFTSPDGDPLPGSGVVRMTKSEAISHYTPWANSLNSLEEKALSNYTGNGYHAINGQLRKGLLDASTAKKVDHIDSAMAKAPPLKETILVHRGVSGGGGSLFAKMNPGDVFLERGFVSTSIGKSSAFGGTFKLNLKVPKGTRASYVSGFGLGIAHEQELLLPRDSKFKITAKYKSGSIHVIEAELLHAPIVQPIDAA